MTFVENELRRYCLTGGIDAAEVVKAVCDHYALDYVHVSGGMSKVTDPRNGKSVTLSRKSDNAHVWRTIVKFAKP